MIGLHLKRALFLSSPLLVAAASVVLLSALTAGPANAATDPGVACAVAKQKAAAKKFSDKVKCHGTALKKGDAVDPACLTRAAAKFDASFAKAETKGGCATTADAATIEAIVDDTLVELLQALPSATTTTTTTTNTVPGLLCPEDGDAAACSAYFAGSGNCVVCCHDDLACTSACDDAAFAGACSLASSVVDCAAAINATGCGDECCP